MGSDFAGIKNGEGKWWNFGTKEWRPELTSGCIVSDDFAEHVVGRGGLGEHATIVLLSVEPIAEVRQPTHAELAAQISGLAQSVLDLRAEVALLRSRS